MLVWNMIFNQSVHVFSLGCFLLAFNLYFKSNSPKGNIDDGWQIVKRILIVLLNLKLLLVGNIFLQDILHDPVRSRSLKFMEKKFIQVESLVTVAMTTYWEW